MRTHAAQIQLNPSYRKAYEQRGMAYSKLDHGDLSSADFEAAMKLPK